MPAPDKCEVDHFIPWSRCPDNGIDNFVVADPRCNGHKRDFLAASKHMERWVRRFDLDGSVAPALKTIAEHELWEHHPVRTIAVARATYLHLPSGAKLWMIRKDFQDADPVVLSRILSIG